MAQPVSFDPLLWKAADRIHDRLDPEQFSLTDLLLPESAWLYWQVCLRTVGKARDRGWTAALNQTRQDAVHALADLTQRLDGARRSLAADEDGPFVASVAEIYRDLVSLRDEFSKVSADCRQKTVSAITDPIDLEETYLGPFEIRLSWTDPPDSPNYEVLACDPHPAATSDDTTHPHVQGNRLCEGEGRMPIRRALQQGRLADFFLIVRQILETYNSGSAYVQLNEWYGRLCPDCGQSYSDFDRVCCTTCETDVCGECARDCEHCASSHCSDCLWICSACNDLTCNACVQACSGCDESHCNACLETCSRCNATRCERCLDEGLCSDCRPKKEKEEDDTPSATTIAASAAAVQPVCVGEAAIPA